MNFIIRAIIICFFCSLVWEIGFMLNRDMLVSPFGLALYLTLTLMEQLPANYFADEEEETERQQEENSRLLQAEERNRRRLELSHINPFDTLIFMCAFSREIAFPSSSTENIRAVAREEVCCICSESLEENGPVTQRFNCIHVLHEACCDKWIRYKRALACPACTSADL